jgi:hypothetical protein
MEITQITRNKDGGSNCVAAGRRQRIRSNLSNTDRSCCCHDSGTSSEAPQVQSPSPKQTEISKVSPEGSTSQWLVLSRPDHAVGCFYLKTQIFYPHQRLSPRRYGVARISLAGPFFSLGTPQPFTAPLLWCAVSFQKFLAQPAPVEINRFCMHPNVGLRLPIAKVSKRSGRAVANAAAPKESSRCKSRSRFRQNG